MSLVRGQHTLTPSGEPAGALNHAGRASMDLFFQQSRNRQQWLGRQLASYVLAWHVRSPASNPGGNPEGNYVLNGMRDTSSVL